LKFGAGVNPEMTGRENIFLNGAILGIPKKIIQQKLDEIIEFSELEQFIDTPGKALSLRDDSKLGLFHCHQFGCGYFKLLMRF